MKIYTTRCTEFTRLNHDVFRARLRLEDAANSSFAFVAGQYLSLSLPDGRSAYFSIASAPEQTQELELHIRQMPGSDLNADILQYLHTGQTFSVGLAEGKACVQATQLSSSTHLVLVAASTGFAQIKSMVEHLLAANLPNPIHLYWAARQEEDIYMEDLCLRWARDYPQLEFIPVLSEPHAGWLGRRGLISEALVEDFPGWHTQQVQIYASGSPAMVYALVDALAPLGVAEERIHSDVFAYAPRP
ncbi:NAD(P)H-flavin reductase [Nitrincola tapanii]|uniref:NAD(P)H-flavin reductase n=1 Tax=Nitrincola tapanii TaxID=1708751 RepID=A0A5A9W692_9GAMM|nr:NAD(P)H-flavin reductase [Nitrincola tapanii]KAA0876202.1 NAD(P)H-flavin reductase [Nitrincola tapanii]